MGERPETFRFLKQITLENRAMKLCHASALALVGWYLMTPPVYIPKDTATSPYKAFTTEKAPLPLWTNDGSFDSASECQREKPSW